MGGKVVSAHELILSGPHGKFLSHFPTKIKGKRPIGLGNRDEIKSKEVPFLRQWFPPFGMTIFLISTTVTGSKLKSRIIGRSDQGIALSPNISADHGHAIAAS